MYTYDVAAYNSFVLHRLKYPEKYEVDTERARRRSLEELARQLIKPCIKMRKKRLENNNFVGIQYNIVNAIIKTGELLNKSPVSPVSSPNRKLETKKYCEICTSSENRSQYKVICTKCSIVICPKHSFQFCEKCKNM